MSYIPLILLGVLLNAAAQLMLKQGMLQVGHFEFALNNLTKVIEKVALNAFIWGGLTSYVVSVVVWMAVLSRVEVSFAYPFLSVGYVVVTIVGYFLFNEAVTPVRLAGVGLVVIGVVLVARS